MNVDGKREQSLQTEMRSARSVSSGSALHSNLEIEMRNVRSVSSGCVLRSNVRSPDLELEMRNVRNTSSGSAIRSNVRSLDEEIEMQSTSSGLRSLSPDAVVDVEEPTTAYTLDPTTLYSPTMWPSSQLRQRFIQIQVVDQRFKEPSWMHPNIGGEAQHLLIPCEELEQIQQRRRPKHGLTEWPATAIGGNDILSSVLFTAGIVTSKAGKLAPISQLLVVFVVYCFRKVFEESMGAIPLNGGCYNIILNASTKRSAGFAATFSILSYVATGVVCAVAAFNYVNYLVQVPVLWSSIGMLLFFAFLCLYGIVESAFVALLFFILHVFTLTLLTITSIIYAIQNPSIWIENWHMALPDVTVVGNVVNGSILTAIFIGFGPAFLSVTGFESSAQFVEEQAPGVFPKTLRNMWILSSVFNMLFSILALGVVPMQDIITHQDVLLAYMGRLTAGHWLEVLVTVDAFIVLAGAVLTSYVGINGLVQRLAIDRLLPTYLLKKNSFRQTTHFIILGYFLVASSLILALNGQITPLAGVFAFAFLGVMGSFACGCLLLKIKREEIPRKTTTSWTNVLFCFLMVLTGMISLALGDLTSLRYFLIYFIGFGSVIGIMLERIRLLKGFLYCTKQILIYFRYERYGRSVPVPPDVLVPTSTSRSFGVIGSIYIAKTIERIKKTPTIFFCKTPHLPKINEAIAYVLQNEQTYCLRLVHVVEKLGEDDEGPPHEFEDIVCLFDHIYPSLKIDFVSISGSFDPLMIEWIASTMAIPTNMMFMRQPAHDQTHCIAAMGVRIITK